MMLDLRNWFSPVESIDAQDFKKLMRTSPPDELQIVDVRTPKEYERGHIPGAILAPLSVLGEKSKELDKDKLTVCY